MGVTDRQSLNQGAISEPSCEVPGSVGRIEREEFAPDFVAVL